MPTFIETSSGDFHLPGEYVLPLQFGVLVLLLIIATVVDVRERRIPNWLVASGMLSALAFHGISPQGEGIAFALSGLALGLAALLPLYMLRVMGAGDVKLMGMTGAFLGVGGVLGTMLASLAAGGILALAMAAGKRMLPQLLANLRGILMQYHISHITRDISGIVRPAASVGSMPYAVAITAGTLAQLTFLHY
jgi:prepilin peptidase CpaA